MRFLSHTFLRFRNFFNFELWLIVASLALLIPDESLGCSCMSTTLENRFNGSLNVFVAEIVGGRLVPNERGYEDVEADIKVLKIYKGPAPVRSVRSSLGGSSCGMSFSVGQKYVFFMGDGNGVSSCSGSGPLAPRRDSEPGRQLWVDMIDDYVSGRTPDLSEPWRFYSGPETCMVSTQFVTTGTRFPMSLMINYRKVVPQREVENPAAEYFQPGYTSVSVLPGGRNKEESPMILTIQGQSYALTWMAQNSRGLGHNARFVLEGREALAFVKSLQAAKNIEVAGHIERLGQRDGVIRTTHIGSAGADMLQCITGSGY